RADVGNGAVVTGTSGDARVEATNLNEVQNISGGAALSLNGGSGVGLAVSVNIANTIEAAATVGDNATLSAGGTATVKAKASFVPVQDTLAFNLKGTQLINQSIGITTFAAGIAGAAGSSGAGVGGSSSVAVILMATPASVGTGATVSGSAGVEVKAEDTLTIFSAAGGIGASAGSAGVGIGLDVGVVTRHTVAHVARGAHLTSTAGNVDVAA